MPASSRDSLDLESPGSVTRCNFPCNLSCNGITRRVAGRMWDVTCPFQSYLVTFWASNNCTEYTGVTKCNISCNLLVKQHCK